MSLQTTFERAFMEDQLDPFDFALAESLGMSVQTMRDTVSNQEYLQWRAYYVYRNAQQELEAKSIQS